MKLPKEQLSCMDYEAGLQIQMNLLLDFFPTLDCADQKARILEEVFSIRSKIKSVERINQAKLNKTKEVKTVTLKSQINENRTTNQLPYTFSRKPIVAITGNHDQPKYGSLYKHIAVFG